MKGVATSPSGAFLEERDRDPNVARCPRTTGSRTGDSNGRSKRKFKCKCHKCGEFVLDMRSRTVGAFKASMR